MIKTLHRTLKLEKEKFKIPKSVQQAIPIQRIWTDGIFQSGRLFSKSFRFTDINYSIASKEDKTEMFLDYSELLNALDSGASAKLTINNRRINKAEFERSILIPMKEDGLDEYRKEYNEVLLSKISDTNNSILRERYLTISVHKKNIDEARTYFARVGTDITTHLAKLSSIGEELDAGERLKIFRDFFKEDVSATAEFDFKEAVKRGHDFKDWFAPDSMEFLQDHFKIDGRYGRILYMQDYATYVRDSMVSELCDLSRNLMLSIDILPVPTDEAVREIQNKLLGVETNVTNWQRRQNENNNFSATIPYEMELQRTETKEMLNDLTTRDQRMMFGVLTIVHMADSYKELNSDTETLKSIARKNLCQLSTLRWQQMDGLHQSISREEVKKIKKRFGENGLVCVAENMNMENYEKVEDFYLDYSEDRETDVTIYEVNNDGSFRSETFIYRNKVLQSFTMTLTWEKGEQAEISNGTANNIAEIKYTSKGYLIYSYEYIVAHAALKEYYRVKPLSDTLRILTDQYVSGFNYLNYNFLTQNWDESNVETILLPRLFEDLYQVHTGEQLKKDSGRVSAELYENVMTACLPVTIEELRKNCGYDIESNTYDSGTFFYRGTSPFCEVVDFLDNSDGTLTLYVDAVWPDRNTDCAFKNEIVIKPYSDGTCQYLSNKIQKMELDIPVYEEY